MRLAISSEALPGASLKELFEASARRGFTGVELVRDVGTGIDEIVRQSAAATWRDEGEVEIVGYRTDSAEEALSGNGAALSACLNAAVTLAETRVEPDLLLEAAWRYRSAGGELLLSAGSEAAEVAELARVLESIGEPALGLALDVRPLRDDLAALGDVLPLAGRWLRLVRLHGGGPEGATQLGRGVGSLMASLGLRRYAHPLVLTPSSSRALTIWSAWLGRKGGWGCGSKAEPISIEMVGAGRR